MDGTRLKILREEKKLKQDELAKILSVSPSAIGMYERNEREPNDELTLKISDFFDVSTDYLLGKIDLRKPYRLKYKDAEGLTDKEIADALKFYKEMKKNISDNK